MIQLDIFDRKLTKTIFENISDFNTVIFPDNVNDLIRHTASTFSIFLITQTKFFSFIISSLYEKKIPKIFTELVTKLTDFNPQSATSTPLLTPIPHIIVLDSFNLRAEYF